MGCLGHCVFLVLHLFAVLFGFVFLIVTIPLHLIFAVLISKREKQKISMSGTLKALFALIIVVILVVVAVQVNSRPKQVLPSPVAPKFVAIRKVEKPVETATPPKMNQNDENLTFDGKTLRIKNLNTYAWKNIEIQLNPVLPNGEHRLFFNKNIRSVQPNAVVTVRIEEFVDKNGIRFNPKTEIYSLLVTYDDPNGDEQDITWESAKAKAAFKR